MSPSREADELPRYFFVSSAFNRSERCVKPADDPDVRLMLALRDGDSSAFDVLFRRHIAAVVRFARSFVVSQARAEELAQDAFIQLYENRRRYEPRAKFTTWLYRIVTNLCLSEMRRAEHRVLWRGGRRETAEDDPPDLQAMEDPGVPNPPDQIEQRQRVETVRAALERLPGQQRAAILLARLQGCSYEEVAQTLGCSVSAVKSLIHRATLALKREMGLAEGADP